MTDEIEATYAELIGDFFSRGNPDDPQFREICYAAILRTLDEFACQTPSQTEGATERKREKLKSLIDATEASYATGSRTFRPTTVAASKHEIADGPNKAAAWGFFVGLTLFGLVGWFLHQTGVIYIHTRPSGFKELKQINDAVATLSPTVDNAIAILMRADARLAEAVKTGEAAKFEEASRRYVNIKEYLPDLAESVAADMPRNTSIIFRVSEDGKGYKVLMHSELCGVVTFMKPEMVDPKLNRYPIFCRYFGFWNKAGEKL